MGGARKPVLAAAGDFTLRSAQAADLPALVSLEDSFAPEDRFSRRQWRRLFAGRTAILILERAGEPVGAAVLLFRAGARAARLYSFVIAPAWRGKGTGAALLAAAEREAVARGCDRVRLEVRRDNASAIALYSKNGFTTVDDLPGYYPDGAAGLRMQKLLIQESLPKP